MTTSPHAPSAMTADEVLAHLRGLQAADLPVHGGRTLAYVYDSGLADADALGLEALASWPRRVSCSTPPQASPGR
jgi:sphinganine-1-phosphate aldolase